MMVATGTGLGSAWRHPYCQDSYRDTKASATLEPQAQHRPCQCHLQGLEALLKAALLICSSAYLTKYLMHYFSVAKITVFLTPENTAGNVSSGKGQVWPSHGDQNVSALVQDKCLPRSRLKSSRATWESEQPLFMFLSLNTKHCFPCWSVWYFSQNNCTRREVRCRKTFLSSQVWNREYL